MTDTDMDRLREIGRLRAALKRSTTAINDWLHVYASDHCDAGRVEEARDRIVDHGGTLAYIADVQLQNSKALDQPK